MIAQALRLVLAATQVPAAREFGLQGAPISIDFGPIARETTQREWLPLTNAGRELVRIVQLESDCSCIEAIPTDFQLTPGRSNPIEIRVSPCEGIGAARRRVSIELSNGERLTVAVHYEITGALYARPELIRFAPPVSDPYEFGVEVRSVRGVQAEILAVVSTASWATCWIESSTIEPAAPARVRVQVVSPPRVTEPGNAEIEIHTTSSAMPLLTIPLRRGAGSGIGVDPPVADFGDCAIGTAMETQFTVRCEPGAQVNEVRPLSRCADVIAVERGDSSAHIRLRTNADLPLGEFTGDISVETVGQTSQRLHVPYRGRVVLRPAGRSNP